VARLSEIMCRNHCFKLTQARWTSLSETDGLAWARAPGLSKSIADSMSFVCCLS